MIAAVYVSTATIAAYKLCNTSNCKYPPTTLQTANQVDENLVYYFMWPNVYKYQTNMLSPYFLHKFNSKVGRELLLEY